jgi:putative peptidoglycan lipid II flippase
MIMSCAQFVDQYLAALLAPGSVAALSYGGKIVSLVIGFVALPLSVTLLPYFATMAAQHRWEKLRSTLLDWSVLLLGMAIPIASVCAYWSIPIVQLLFERGAFSSADTALVARIQGYLLLQLPFYVVGILWVRVLTALQRTRLVALVALTNATINIAASLVLIPSEGVAGIAMAISLGYIVASSLAGCFTFWLLNAAIRCAVTVPSSGPPEPLSRRSIFDREEL